MYLCCKYLGLGLTTKNYQGQIRCYFFYWLFSYRQKQWRFCLAGLAWRDFPSAWIWISPSWRASLWLKVLKHLVHGGLVSSWTRFDIVFLAGLRNVRTTNRQVSPAHAEQTSHVTGCLTRQANPVWMPDVEKGRICRHDPVLPLRSLIRIW